MTTTTTKNNLQTWARRRQCAEPERTETRKKQKHQPNRNHRRSQQILTTNTIDKLMRFVVPSQIMSIVRELTVATPRDKPHDKHKSPLTETHPTRKWQNTHADAQDAKRHTISNTTSWPMFHNELHRSHGNAKRNKVHIEQRRVKMRCQPTRYQREYSKKSAYDTTPNSRVDQTHKQHALP